MTSKKQLAEEVARLEKAFWRKVIPRLCAHVRAARQPLNSASTIEAARRIGDETAREVFSAALAARR
jgi:hypothetical protein